MFNTTFVFVSMTLTVTLKKIASKKENMYLINIIQAMRGKTPFAKNKEVFVKHEQAPTVPKLESVFFFVDLKYIFYETVIFGQFDNFPSGVFV